MVLVASLLFIPQAMATSVERAVIPMGNNTYRVILFLSEETVAGISERFPAGYEISEVSVPAGHYRIDGDTLHIAVLGKGNASYTINGDVDPECAIQGSWTDVVTGEGGRVYAMDETTPPAEGDHEKDMASPAGKAGSAPLLTCIVANAVFLVVGRRFAGRRDLP